jgi:alpha-galactosidase
VIVKSDKIEIHFDRKLHSKVVAKYMTQRIQLSDFSASEYIIVDSMEVKEFLIDESRSTRIIDSIGAAEQYMITGKNSRLKKKVSVIIYDDFPTMAFFDVQYINISKSDIQIESWSNHSYTINKGVDTDPVAFWSYMGASYGWDNDWIQPLEKGFKRKNYMGMNWADYGGGTPIVDLWWDEVGIAIGHVESSPRLVSLPVSVPTDSTANIALTYSKPVILKPGEKLSSFRSFVAVHKGDYYNSLKEYSRFMSKLGFDFKDSPSGSYETIWCGWGYEENFNVKDLSNTLQKVNDLNIDWAVLDFGWSTGVGDYEVSKNKFPSGEEGMKKLIHDIHSADAKAKLWWAPLAVHPKTKLYKEHPEYLLLNKDGSKRDIEFWSSFTLCPASEEVIEYSRNLVIKMLKDWGWDGLKIDGNHLNGVPPCYNNNHNHLYPEESVEKLQDFFKMIYETALSINPNAVIEICPCGQTYSFYNLTYMNQSVSSDPSSSWQIRHKGKTLKALCGSKVAYYGDHVELSTGGNDFASTIGIGGVPGTKFVWPPGVHMNRESGDVSLTASKEKEWAKWMTIYKEQMLSKGNYRGELYDIGYDHPEGHVVQRGDTLYYAFYVAEDYSGEIELKGLEDKAYRLNDYFNMNKIGKVSASKNRFDVSFKRFLLLEAIPEDAKLEKK